MEEKGGGGGLSSAQKSLYCKTYTASSSSSSLPQRIKEQRLTSSKTIVLPIRTRKPKSKTGRLLHETQDFQVLGGTILSGQHRHHNQRLKQRPQRQQQQNNTNAHTNAENCAGMANQEDLQVISLQKCLSTLNVSPSTLTTKEEIVSRSKSSSVEKEEEDIVRRVMRLLRKVLEGWRHVAQQTSTAKLELVSVYLSRIYIHTYYRPHRAL